ncbi:MAG: sodium-translocating pyrophosphatase [Bacillota bacterium]|nr:sodium-translocating pyrophosphatase [Bacillota bacterium]
MGQNLLLLAPSAAVLALLFTRYLAARVARFSEGPPNVVEIAEAVRQGASAYLRRQYTTVAGIFAVMLVVLLLLSRFGYVSVWTPLAFLSGGFFSALAGFIGMKQATNSAARTAMAAKESLNGGLQVAFSAGAVMGLTVVGLGLVHISFWYYFLSWFYQGDTAVVMTTLLTSSMGASFLALFARVGGGIFTKAADVGADLVGKVEAGIPEDDPRNPAVIADNVGDNVGDVAGMGADLYESYVGAIIAAASLGLSAGLGLKGTVLPIVLAGVGVLCSIAGTFAVRVGETASQGALLAALRRGVYLAAGLIVVLTYFLIQVLVPGHLGLYWAILAGLVAGIIISLVSEYYTSSEYKPTKDIADSAQTGPATVVISGLSVGMLSTAVPTLVVGIAILASYYLSQLGGPANFDLGLYGIALAAVGMLSTLGITLATDAYGPVADNAGGIAEMGGLGKEVRERTDALDALGNTTAATGKGFAIASAGLTALALLAAFRDQVAKAMADQVIARDGALATLGKAAAFQKVYPGVVASLDAKVTLLNPQTLVGLLLGAVLPFLFGALTMGAVGRAAQKIVEEVRRQFREIPGLMEGKAKPDYRRSVDICTRAALREMVVPALLAVVMPIGVGLLLGVNAVLGLLAGATISGFIMALMMANSGGAWDNAKKYIEGGVHGGKGSAAHKAAVAGDTVGDPFKDTSGPSLNILIKLLSMVALAFSSFILANTLFR